jgi:hypothetical protein
MIPPKRPPFAVERFEIAPVIGDDDRTQLSGSFEDGRVVKRPGRGFLRRKNREARRSELAGYPILGEVLVKE